MTITIVITVLGLLAVTLAVGVRVTVSLISVGLISLGIFRSVPVEKLLSQMVRNVTTTPKLLALPMFILMAEILFRTRLSETLFAGITPWTTRLPGRLLHVNVLGCTLLAAISGSSAATTATVGRITLTELFRRGGDRDLSMGSLAGAGTPGLLIPPSLVLIVYGVLSETSILKLFIAGVVGVLLVSGLQGTLTIGTMRQACYGAVRTISMIGLTGRSGSDGTRPDCTFRAQFRRAAAHDARASAHRGRRPVDQPCGCQA